MHDFSEVVHARFTPAIWSGSLSTSGIGEAAELPKLWPDLVLPLLGWAPGDRGAHHRALKALADLFAVLEHHLSSCTFLVTLPAPVVLRLDAE